MSQPQLLFDPQKATSNVEPLRDVINAYTAQTELRLYYLKTNQT